MAKGAIFPQGLPIGKAIIQKFNLKIILSIMIIQVKSRGKKIDSLNSRILASEMPINSIR